MGDRTCAVKECDRAEHARGYCRKHYYRLRKHGDPLFKITSWDRFWAKVDAAGPCWEWTGNKDVCGYGDFHRNKSNRKAHRIAWEMLVGPIPDGMELDHLCRVRHCVNPDHLQPVTHTVNVRRGIGGITTAKRQRSKTHCPKGHAYAGENLYIDPRGSRQCRSCRRAAVAACYERKGRSPSKRSIA